MSPNDLTVLLTQLWCRDFHEYRGNPPDRARVQMNASLLLYCFTSARTGEVHESSARRADARQAQVQEVEIENEDEDEGEKEMERKEMEKKERELEARVLSGCYKV